MGARTTWEIRQYENTPSIYLYSHWGGNSKWGDTATALTAAIGRWDDPAYGARIIISQIVGTNWSQETGFGVVAGPVGEIPFEEEFFNMVIDFTTKKVYAGDLEYTFDEFITAQDVSEGLVEAYWAAYAAEVEKAGL